MSHLMELILAAVRESNGISAFVCTRQINKSGQVFTLAQVSGALQRLRARGLVAHRGGWSATKGSVA